MRVRRRSAIFYLASAALGASQLYACGIDLDTAPGDDGDGGSSSSGRPGASSSGVGPSSSGGSGGGSSGVGPSSSGSSGEPIDDSGAPDVVDVPDSSACEPVTLTDFQCPLTTLGSPNTYASGDLSVTCARKGTGAATSLTTELQLEEGALWIKRQLRLDQSWTIELELTQTRSNLAPGDYPGTSFGIAIVNRNEGSAATAPATGGPGTAAGILGLTDYGGPAMTFYQVTPVRLLPGYAGGAFVTSAGDQDLGASAAFADYRLTLSHVAGEAVALGNVYRDSAQAPLNTTPVSVAVNAITTDEQFVGVYAATGNSYVSAHTLKAVRITCP